MSQWSLLDIPWDKFERDKATPALISVTKAASLVEYNSRDYARYLAEVFAGDALFQQAARRWAEEEVQHGRALRKWAEMADPEFNFEKSFDLFQDGFRLPHVTESVRGSHASELVARCMVEIGTSSYYAAIRDYTDEPVLREIAAHIAADEIRHYKLFYSHLQRYLQKENLGSLKRLKVILARIAESEDDELAYAFYASHRKSKLEPYNRRLYSRRYLAAIGQFYRKQHVDHMVTMVFKAIGLRRSSLLNRFTSRITWYFLQLRLHFSQSPHKAMRA